MESFVTFWFPLSLFLPGCAPPSSYSASVATVGVFPGVAMNEFDPVGSCVGLEVGLEVVLKVGLEVGLGVSI